MPDLEVLTTHPPAAEIENLLNIRTAATNTGEQFRVEGPLFVSEESFIYRAGRAGIPHPILIKLPRGAAPTARSQYEALLFARRRLQGRLDLTVPIPYSCLLDDGFIMMEWIDAPTIDQMLRAVKTPIHALFRAMEAAGRWLRAFHGDITTANELVDVDEMLDVFVDLSGDGTGCADFHGRPGKHFGLLGETREVVKQFRANASTLHGDFKPQNLLIKDKRVIALDISGYRREQPVVLDMAYFLLHIDLSLVNVKGMRLTPWRHQLRAAFLRGYGVPETSGFEVVLAWCELYQALRHYYIRSGIHSGYFQWRLRSIVYTWLASVRARSLHQAVRRILP